MANPLFYAAAEVTAATSAYPWEEINDYVRFRADQADAVRRTLAYFDPRHLAPRVRAAVYLPHDRPGGLFTADRLAPLAAALPDGPTLYQLTGYGYTDRLAQEAWLADRLGMAG
jgi:hypothetical protein